MLNFLASFHRSDISSKKNKKRENVFRASFGELATLRSFFCEGKLDLGLFLHSFLKYIKYLYDKLLEASL